MRQLDMNRLTSAGLANQIKWPIHNEICKLSAIALHFNQDQQAKHYADLAYWLTNVFWKYER